MVEARGGGGGGPCTRAEDRWAEDRCGGGETALQTKRPEWAASADPSARTAPHRGRTFRQGHRLEQVAQGGPVDHLGARATAPRRGPAV